MSQPAASAPRAVAALRVLVVDAEAGTVRIARATDLAECFEAGDLLVVNDAATMPASLRAHTARGERIELRLAGNVDGARRWTAALLGAGDHRMRTEDRPPPARMGAGERLLVDGPDGLVAVVERVHALSSRLVDVAFELPLRRTSASSRAVTDADIWAALYRAGKPVQYAHIPDALALWDVQNAWAARPWAVEMPSAGRALTVEAMRALRVRGVGVGFVTHAAGLSSVGDAAIDAALPLPERYEVPAETVRAALRAERVIAVGTSVVRALEGAAARRGRLVTGTGVTDLRLGPGSKRRVVDAVLTGVHDADTTHHALLEAFASEAVLEAAGRRARQERFLGHEFGDAWLVWGQPRDSLRTKEEAGRRDTIRRSEAGGAVETRRSSATVAA